jgi:hypothetical protein
MDRNEIRKQFEQRIRRFGRVRRTLGNAARFYRTGSLALLAGMAALLLLCGWTANPFVNVALALAGAVTLLVLLVRLLLRWERSLPVLVEAFRMEALAGDLYSRLISAVDFLRHEETTPSKEAVIAAAQQDLTRPFESLLNRTERNRWRKWFVLLLVAFVALGAFSPFGFGRAGRTVAVSLVEVRERLFPTRYELFPGPGRTVCRVGTNVVVGIRFTRFGYPEVTMLCTRVGGEGDEREVLRVDAARRAGRTLPAVTEAREYEVRFRFGRRVTAPMHLVFTTPPVIENMQTELTFPAYTRMVPKELEGVVDRITALPGTRVSMGFTFSKPLASAALTYDDGERVPLDVAGRFASISFLHTQERRARLQVEDLHGFALEVPYAVEFSLSADKPPKLIMPPYLKQDMPCPVAALDGFGFGVRAEDDYGVAKCVLHWKKSTVEDRDSVKEKGDVERPLLIPKTLAVVPFEKIFAEQGGKPGDFFSFQVEAFDNRLPKAQSTVSVWFSLFLHGDELGGGSLGGGEKPIWGEPGGGPGPGTRGYGIEGKRNVGVALPGAYARPEQGAPKFARENNNDTRGPSAGGDTRTKNQYTTAVLGGGK